MGSAKVISPPRSSIMFLMRMERSATSLAKDPDVSANDHRGDDCPSRTMEQGYTYEL